VAAARRRPATPVASPAPLATNADLSSAATPSVVAPAPAPVPTAPLSTLSFPDVKALVPDGAKTKEADVWLDLDGSGVVVRRADRSVVKTVPYGAILSATYTEAKNPRWSTADGLAAVPPAYGNRGSSFLSRSRNWLTLQSKDDFIIVRLERDNVSRVLEAVESRAKVKVQKAEGNDKD
jgi:hypothetical protein